MIIELIAFYCSVIIELFNVLRETKVEGISLLTWFLCVEFLRIIIWFVKKLLTRKDTGYEDDNFDESEYKYAQKQDTFYDDWYG